MKGILKISLLFFFLLSCSYRETILRKAPDFLSEKIDDYLKLNEAQELELRTRITASFFEHHKEVKKLRKIIANYDVSKDSLRDQVKDGYPSYARVMKDINIISIDVLSKLNYEQRKELIVKQKTDEDNVDNDDISFEQRGIKRLESVFGKLSDKQVALVKKLVITYLGKRKSLKEKTPWRIDFVNTLEIQDQEKYKYSLKKKFSDVEGLNQVMKDNEYFFQFFEQFRKTLSKEQIANFNNKKKDILSWIDLYLKIYQTPINHT